jgi:ADP-heptose:LPS heptosyltransferase
LLEREIMRQDTLLLRTIARLHHGWDKYQDRLTPYTGPRSFETYKITVLGPENQIETIQALPAFEALTRYFKHSEFTWIGEGPVVELLKYHTKVTRTVVPWDVSRLNETVQDLIINLVPGYARSYFMYRSGIRFRVGPAMGKDDYLLTKALHIPETVGDDQNNHVVDRFIYVARQVGGKARGREPVFPVSEEEKKAGLETLKKAGFKNPDKIVLISKSSGYSGHFSIATWDDIIKHLDNDGYELLRIRETGNRNWLLSIDMRQDLTVPVENVPGLLANCGRCVGEQTIGLNLAAAVGVPVIGLFMISDPRIIGPIGKGHRLVFEGGKESVKGKDIINLLNNPEAKA